MDYRTAGIAFIHPERLIWKPAVWLQELITATGRSLLPENDGEHAIWVYHFVLAPYINRLHAPHTKEVHKLIDSAEFVLETLATKKIKDPIFSNKNKFVIYPLTALYYAYTYKGKYFLKPTTKSYYQGLYQDRAQYEYLKQLVQWMIEKEAEWKKHQEVLDYINQKPDIELIQLVSVAVLLHDIIYYQIHSLGFSCDDTYVRLYYDYINRYIADGSPYHKVDRQLQRRFDNPLIFHGARINFFGHQLCGFPKLPAYNIKSVESLRYEGPGWGEAFVQLKKKMFDNKQIQGFSDKRNESQNE